MGRISMLDAQIWLCKIKKKNILQFEYKNLPKELKDKAALHRAKGEGLIISIGKNGNGRHVWKIVDNIKCKDDIIKEDVKGTDENVIINEGDT